MVDDTNLEPKHEVTLRKLAEDIQKIISPRLVTFETKFFEVALEEAIRRDLKRPVSVGEGVIKGMYDRYLAPAPAIYHAPEGKTRAIICDIDGTLAHHTDRSPYAWHRVGEDLLDDAVKEVLGLYRPSHAVILLSGRDGVCRPETEAWLAQHNVKYDHLFMRAEGDNRKDNIIKRELFDELVKDNYQVTFVLDDRDQVVNMWRNELGLKVFQVAPGAF